MRSIFIPAVGLKEQGKEEKKWMWSLVAAERRTQQWVITTEHTMKAAQELKSGKENQVYYVFWNIYVSKNINSVSKENQQRPLQPMKCCATIATIFITQV